MNTKTMGNQLPPSIRSFEELRSMFDYDRALPLKVEESGVEHKGGVSIHDVSYASPSNGRVSAYLVMPSGKGPFAGVIFVHPAPGDRSTFLEEAVMLAKKGAVSLLIDAPWAQGEAWARTMGQPESDRQQHHQTAINIRRAVDVISSRPEVDAERLGYVGHSFGALFGGILAGVEKRIKTYVLMTGVGSFTDVVAANIPSLTEQELEEYSQVIAPIDPIYYVGQAAPSALFFQFGSQDDFFSREKFLAYYETGSEPKFVKWYNVGHFMEDEQARDDRLEWLGEQLGLEKQNSQTSPSSTNSADEAAIRALYQQLLASWNRRDAREFAALFAKDGNLVGFDGSQYNGRAETEAEIGKIFADHQTATYVWKVREVRLLTPDVAILRAVVGMVQPGQSDLNPAVNAVQSLVATKQNDQWRIALFQNTPTQFHGRPELVQKLTEELRQLL